MIDRPTDALRKEIADAKLMWERTLDGPSEGFGDFEAGYLAALSQEDEGLVGITVRRDEVGRAVGLLAKAGIEVAAASPVASREVEGHIEWWDDPNADVEGAKGFNRRYFQHVGCDEGNVPWVVPKDDCPPPKGTRECARCDLVLPLLEKASKDG